MWPQVEATPSGTMDGRLSCGCRLVHTSCVISTVRLSLSGSTPVPSSSAEQTSPERCQASSVRSMWEHEAVPVSGGCLIQAHKYCSVLRSSAPNRSPCLRQYSSLQTKQTSLFRVAVVSLAAQLPPVPILLASFIRKQMQADASV